MYRTITAWPAFKYFVALLQAAYHSPTDEFLMHEAVVINALSDPKADPTLSEAFMMLILPLYFAARGPEAYLKWAFQLAKEEADCRLRVPAMLALAASEPKYVSVKEAVDITGISESPWRVRCHRGEVVGAILVGGTWMIPEFELLRRGFEVS